MVTSLRTLNGFGEECCGGGGEDADAGEVAGAEVAGGEDRHFVLRCATEEFSCIAF